MLIYFFEKVFYHLHYSHPLHGHLHGCHDVDRAALLSVVPLRLRRLLELHQETPVVSIPLFFRNIFMI